MIPGVKIISRKVSVTTQMELGGLGVFWDPSKGFMGRNPLRKFSGSKKQLDWLKIGLNTAKIITTEDYKHTKS